MRRRGMLVGAWVVATAVATLVAWGAVRQVTDEVSPQAAFPLPTQVALADSSPTPSEAPATTRPARKRQRREQKPAATTPPVQPTQRPADPPPATQQPDNPPEEKPEPEPEPQPESRNESYKLIGGFVTVRYSGSETHLVQATPNSGFVVEINDRGPGKVDVRFESDRHESRLVTRIHDGQPDPQEDEDPR